MGLMCQFHSKSDSKRNTVTWFTLTILRTQALEGKGLIRKPNQNLSLQDQQKMCATEQPQDT